MGAFNDNSQNDHLGHFKFSTERGPPGPKGQPGVGYKQLEIVTLQQKLILNLKTLKKLIKLMLIQKFLK